MDAKPDTRGKPNAGSIFKFVNSWEKFAMSQDVRRPAAREELYLMMLSCVA